MILARACCRTSNSEDRKIGLGEAHANLFLFQGLINKSRLLHGVESGAPALEEGRRLEGNVVRQEDRVPARVGLMLACDRIDTLSHVASTD